MQQTPAANPKDKHAGLPLAGFYRLYEAQLRAEHRSAKTIKNYREALGKFRDWFEASYGREPLLGDLTAVEARLFLAHALEQPKWQGHPAALHGPLVFEGDGALRPRRPEREVDASPWLLAHRPAWAPGETSSDQQDGCLGRAAEMGKLAQLWQAKEMYVTRKPASDAEALHARVGPSLSLLSAAGVAEAESGWSGGRNERPA